MSRILKVISNEEIRIEEYKNPRVCFNNTEYDDIENYCVLRETINPFQMLYKNRELQQRIDKAIEYIMQPNIEIKEYHSCDMDYIYVNEKLLEILKGGSNEYVW